MICKNCGEKEAEKPFGWCTECLDDPANRSYPITKIVTINGRIYRKHVDHAKARRIYRKHYNARIPRGYQIHHIDGDHDNNDPANLVCLSLKQHIKVHETDSDPKAVIILKRQLNGTYE